MNNKRIKKYCASCGTTDEDFDFCELDNKGSDEWICKDCAFKLNGCLNCSKNCFGQGEDEMLEAELERYRERKDE